VTSAASLACAAPLTTKEAPVSYAGFLKTGYFE
jgi:hypothetical protein